MVTCITDRHADIRLIKQATPVTGFFLFFLVRDLILGLVCYLSVSGERPGRYEVRRKSEKNQSPNEIKSGNVTTFFTQWDLNVN